MKTLLKKLPVILLLVSITIIGASCDNDSSPSPNDNQCNYQGLTYVDANGNINTQIPDGDLNTEYFSNGQNVEIWTAQGTTLIVTDAITNGAIDNSPQIKINGNFLTGTVTCQRVTGLAVGDELRYDIVIAGGAEAELCVTIDTVN